MFAGAINKIEDGQYSHPLFLCGHLSMQYKSGKSYFFINTNAILSNR